MEKLTYFFVLTSLISCNVSKTRVIEKANIPVVKNTYEVFDIAAFEKSVDAVSGKRTLIDNDLHIIEDYQSPGFSRVIYNKNSSFYALRLFFENGNIKTKGISFNNGSEYGTWYHFNETGDFESAENTDKGYNFQWADILQYCEDNNITLDKGYPDRGGLKPEIWKDEVDGKKSWKIRYYDFQAEKYLEVRLDGNTGKEVHIRELKVVGP